MWFLSSENQRIFGKIFGFERMCHFDFDTHYLKCLLFLKSCTARIWKTCILQTHLLFIARFFRKEKKRLKIEGLNIKTIRFDKKKWKDNLVLHYLIIKWICFLITFRRHQDLQISISLKSLILQTKKFLQNDARIQKRLKVLAFVGRYNLLNGRFLEHLPTKVLHLNVPLMMSVPQFSSKILKNFKKTRLL